MEEERTQEVQQQQTAQQAPEQQTNQQAEAQQTTQQAEAKQESPEAAKEEGKGEKKGKMTKEDFIERLCEHNPLMLLFVMLLQPSLLHGYTDQEVQEKAKVIEETRTLDRSDMFDDGTKFTITKDKNECYKFEMTKDGETVSRVYTPEESRALEEQFKYTNLAENNAHNEQVANKIIYEMKSQLDEKIAEKLGIREDLEEEQNVKEEQDIEVTEEVQEQQEEQQDQEQGKEQEKEQDQGQEASIPTITFTNMGSEAFEQIESEEQSQSQSQGMGR